MSLAKRTGPVQPSLAPVEAVSVNGTDNIMRLVMNGAEQLSSRRKPVGPETEFGTSFDLITKAAKAMEALQARCAMLEKSLAQETENFRAELDEARQDAAEWERRATTVKSHLADCENRISELQLRAESTLHRAEHAEARLIVAEQQASAAMTQARQYHDRIIDAFGEHV